ncbi:MAG TPA: hypothetical protein VGH04_11175 [Gemmatimonadaceae bacterium]
MGAVIPVSLASQQPDARPAAGERSTRAARPTAPGAASALDTLTIVAGPGIRGQIGAQTIRVRGAGSDDIRTLTMVSPHGKKLAYSIAADAGYENPIVLLDDDSIGIKGTITVLRNQSLAMAADRAIRVGGPNRKLYNLLRRQLTATDPLSAYVDVECETERLLKAFPDSGEKLIDAAEQRAIDPTRDAKALRRIDDALGGRVFEGCAGDRKTYQKTP